MKSFILATMVMANNIFNPAHKLFTQQAKRKRKGMALIKTGGGVAQISGSIGGTTFSRNRYGAIARNRSLPVNPNTALQQKVRSVVGNLAQEWFNSLTSAQRSAWDTYAANVSVLNRLGDTINLTGFNMYVRTNTALEYADIAGNYDAPTNFTLAEQDPTLTVTASEATQQISVAFDTALDWVSEDGAYLMLYVSRPQNDTINYFKGPYQYAGKIAGDATTAPTSPQVVSAPQAFVEGQKLFVQARIVRADGRLSNPFRVDCVSAA